VSWRVVATVFGLLVGVATGVGLAFAHAEERPPDGRRVVPWIWKNKLVETPLPERCFVLAVGLGALGAVAGNRFGHGAGLVPTAIITLAVVGLVRHVQDGMPVLHGHVGENSKIAANIFAAFLGAAVGASASARVRSEYRRRP
jgi:hypothetical protein